MLSHGPRNPFLKGVPSSALIFVCGAGAAYMAGSKGGGGGSPPPKPVSIPTLPPMGTGTSAKSPSFSECQLSEMGIKTKYIFLIISHSSKAWGGSEACITCQTLSKVLE